MIRRFNYTGRKKIARSQVTVVLNPTPDGRLAFDAFFHPQNLTLPPSANIFLEAYRRAYFRRFPCGTVLSPKFPRNCTLEGLDSGALVMFRVKVVGKRGRILAMADRIIPRREDEEATDKLCLLPVDYVDLGQSVWRLDLASDWPSLQLNKRIENIREIARSDPSFIALVYPEIIRQILHQIIVEEDHTDPDTDPDDWMSRWLRFALSTLGTKELPPAGDSEPILQDKLKWIDDAVEGFSSAHRLLEKFIQGQERGG